MESFADVVQADVSGSSGNYNFSVTLSSPDKGCEQYADWWEIVSEEGDLIYRRILMHSHVSEQPFTRSGGPVSIPSTQIVWIRGHMNNSGYGGRTFKGSVQDGFTQADMPAGFAAQLEKQTPLPEDCWH